MRVGEDGAFGPETAAPQGQAPQRGKQPRCPSCRWFLRFTAEGYSWVGECRNNNCPVGVVPPTVNRPLVEFVSANGGVTAEQVAARFGWSQTNANNHLQSLLRLCLIRRERIPAKSGGKLFMYRAVSQ